MPRMNSTPRNDRQKSITLFADDMHDGRAAWSARTHHPNLSGLEPHHERAESVRREEEREEEDACLEFRFHAGRNFFHRLLFRLPLDGIGNIVRCNGDDRTGLVHACHTAAHLRRIRPGPRQLIAQTWPVFTSGSPRSPPTAGGAILRTIPIQPSRPSSGQAPVAITSLAGDVPTLAETVIVFRTPHTMLSIFQMTGAAQTLPNKAKPLARTITNDRPSHQPRGAFEWLNVRTRDNPCNACNTSTPRLRRDRHELQPRIVRRPPLRPAFLCRNARSGMDRYISKSTVALNFSRGAPLRTAPQVAARNPRPHAAPSSASSRHPSLPTM